MTNGKITNEFETLFSKYLGVKHTLALSSATAALHLALLSLDVGVGDEVITTPLTFASTAHVIEHVGAKTIFVDVEKDTGLIDLTRVEKAITKNTKAIIPVHVYGQMCDMLKLKSIADANNIKIIEDAAHAIESSRHDIKPCQLSDASAFSFYATKNITSGDGGALVTNSQTLLEKAKIFSLHGLSTDASDRYFKKFKQYDVVNCGWKYNITDIQSSLLVPQLNKIEQFLKRREDISKIYDDAFAGHNQIKVLDILPNSKSARHLYPIFVPEHKRNQLIEHLINANIGISVHFKPLHLMTYYKSKYHFKKGDFPISEHIGNSEITLPLYPKLKDDEVNYVIDAVLSFF